MHIALFDKQYLRRLEYFNQQIKPYFLFLKHWKKRKKKKKQTATHI